MSDDYEAPDSDFFGAPEHREYSTTEFHELLFNDHVPPDFSRLERKGMKFVRQPPTWQSTPSGRTTRTMDDFIKENFPNGMYIPGYMLWKRD